MDFFFHGFTWIFGSSDAGTDLIVSSLLNSLKVCDLLGLVPVAGK